MYKRMGSSQHKQRCGRTLVATLKKDNHILTLIHMYSPTVKKHQLKYYENLTQTIKAFHFQYPIVLAGDFNNKKLRDNRKPHFRTLQTLLDSYNLVDIFEETNPDSTDTTHSATVTKTSHRLDRLYTNKKFHFGKVLHLKETLNFTDHRAS